MADLMGFDANQVKPNEGADPIPAGNYDVVIVQTEGGVTDSGKFRFIKLQMQVLNGPHQNRKLFDNLNIARDPSYSGPWTEKDEMAVTIGKGDLSALCRAVNVLTPKDSDELKGKPFTVKVTVKKSDMYGLQNNVASYKPRQAGGTAPGGAMFPPVPQSATSQPAAAQTSGNWPPPNPFG